MIFLFLKSFGSNQFDIPVYYQSGVVDTLDNNCGRSTAVPYLVNTKPASQVVHKIYHFEKSKSPPPFNDDKEFIDQNQDIFEIYYAKDMDRWDKREITSSLKGKKVYLTFDLSGFDSSVMPATGMPEPNGFFWPDVMRIIKQAAKISDIVGIDIVELAPISYLHSCDILAAKLGYKILSHIFNQK